MNWYEIEAKWEITFAAYRDLHDYFMKMDGAKRISSTDHFYHLASCGDDLLRLRIRPDGAGFITVKKLIQKYVRRENEIKLSKDNEPEQVFKVLEDLGAEERLQIHKAGLNFELYLGAEREIPCHIGLYLATANNTDMVRFFLELEIDKEYTGYLDPKQSTDILQAAMSDFLDMYVYDVCKKEDVKECDKLLYQYFGG